MWVVESSALWEELYITIQCPKASLQLLREPLMGGHRSLEDGMADGCTEGLLDPARASRMHSQVI